MILYLQDTQTDEIGFIQPNSNPKVNMYLNPIENQPLRIPSSNSKRNSRTRLSGVSIGGEKATTPSSPDHSFTPIQKSSENDIEPDVKQRRASENLLEPKSRRRSRNSAPNIDFRKGEVPRIKISDSGSENDEGMGAFVPLRISESSSPQSNSMRRSKNKRIENNQVRRLQDRNSRSSPDRSGGKSRNSRTSNSESPSTSTEELHSHYSQYNGRSHGRKYSDSISWNERGSPEQPMIEEQNNIEDPRYKKDCNSYSQFPNGFKFRNSNDVHEDEPSIPI